MAIELFSLYICDIWLTLNCRNSPTRIGGLATTAASLVFSLLTMLSLIRGSKSGGLKKGIGHKKWRNGKTKSSTTIAIRAFIDKESIYLEKKVLYTFMFLFRTPSACKHTVPMESIHHQRMCLLKRASMAKR